jgi:hypothetical protein
MTSSPLETQAPIHPPASQHAYELGGRKVRISLWDSDLASALSPRLAAFRCGDAERVNTILEAWTEGDTGWIRRGGRCVVKDTPLSLRANLLKEIAGFWNPEVEWLAMLHAGAVAKGSRCVLLPATTGAGKSTLVAALVHRNFELLTEDLALITNRDLNVAILPHAIKVREGSWGTLHSLCPDLDSLPTYVENGQNCRFMSSGRVSALTQMPARCLVFPRFVPGAPTEVNDLSTFDALARLADSGLWVDEDHGKIAIFLKWFQSTPKYSLVYSDIEAAVRVIEDLI